MSSASRHTPHSSASHGRITTQNTNLVALLRENTGGAAPNKVSVDSNALNVVTNSELSTNNKAAHNSELVNNNRDIISKSSYNSRQNTYETIAKRSSGGQRSGSYVDNAQPSSVAHHNSQALKDTQLEQANVNVAQHKLDTDKLDSPEKETHHKYSYRPLKSSEHTSRPLKTETNNSAHALADHKGDGEQFHSHSEHLQPDITAQKSGVTASFSNNNAHRSALDSKSGTLVLDKPRENSSQLHENSSQIHARKLPFQQNSNINDHAQHINGSVKNEKLNKDVPRLDLSNLSPARNSPISATDSESENYPAYSAAQNLQLNEIDNSKYLLLHFSAHDKYPTGRTYEVESPVETNQVPHINSYTNFREGGSSQLGDPDTFRDREQGPEKLTPGQSDLADDLKVPYPFDTQANEVETEKDRNQIKPPSPPVQTTPPPDKEPATSLRSNSNVYAVANPEIQRAQGINPPPDAQFTPRQYSNSNSKNFESGEVNNYRTTSRSKYEQDQVRFDHSADQRRSEVYGETPVRERVPTPFARSPKEVEHLSPGELHTKSPTEWDTPREQPRKSGSGKARGKGLPPQHPPLDTKPPSRDTNLKDDTISVKRVYVESPSFTKEEEEEYRFVSSRLDDPEDKDFETFREMDDKVQRGYGGDDNHSGYGKARGDYNVREKAPERARDRNSYDERRERNERKKYDQDRYEDRNHEMNGYSEKKDRPNDRYDDRNKYNYDKENVPYPGKTDRYSDDNRQVLDKQSYDSRQIRDKQSYSKDTDAYSNRKERYNSEKDRYERKKYGYDKESDPFERQERYDRLQDEREQYDQDRNRYPQEPVKEDLRKQNTEMDLEDLQKEEAYQRDLQLRIEYEKRRDKELVMPQVPFSDRDNYQNDNFARDSLEYPSDRDRQNFARDSLEYNGYAQQSRDWGQPPQIGDFEKQSSKPDFYDPDDAERMEVVNPRAPRVDYIEKNKHDYGFLPRKTYRDIVHRKREENEKLDHVFITPKVPSKASKHKHPKKTQSAQPEHMGHQPPEPQPYPLGFKPSSAEELWAQRSSFLARKSSTNGSADGGKKIKSAGKAAPKSWNVNTKVNQPYTYQPPAPLPNQGQLYKPQNVAPSPGGNQGYTTPTRLQPIEHKPQPPIATDLVPTAVDPSSPFRRHMELKPITQEITTEDGQRISVDINLRLISPPPGHSSPHGSQQGALQQQQLALVPVQETQRPLDDGPQPRGIGVPYQMQDRYGEYPDNSYGNSYQQEPVENDQYGNEPLQYTDVSPHQGEMSLVEPSGYALKHKYETEYGYKEEDTTSETKSIEEGYAAIYHKMKSKDPADHPWYKVYNIEDYKKMQREVRLNRGTLGPDLDTEPYKEKMEKRHKQFEYARMVMEKNRIELGSKKPPKFPRETKEENHKRKMALEYAKNVPKPTVKPRPNQYNSYEVSAQISPGGAPVKRSSPTGSKPSPQPSQQMDVIDIRTLEQRHLAERKNADKIRQNMDSVLSQKAA